jgi:hypothetical protein
MIKMSNKVAAQVVAARKTKPVAKVIIQTKVAGNRGKKPPARPVPDVKGATQVILARVAEWMAGKEAEPVVYAGLASGPRASPAEWAVLEEARALAVEYVRMGARL